MRRLTLILFTALLAAGLAAARPETAHADNTAVAINTKDGSALFKFAFAIRRVGGDIVDETNAAVAYASCTECQTVAIAIEVVLVTGDPSVVSPENYAIAINQECTLCETLASAYQFVFSTDGQVHFTAEGNQELAELRRLFQQLRKEAESLSVQEVQARVAELVNRLRTVLASQLVSAGSSGTPPGSAGGGSGGGGSGATETMPTQTQPAETTPTTQTTEPTTTETTTTETTETAP